MSSKLLTLATAREELGRYIENGTCSLPTIDARINEVVQRLVAKPEMQDSPRLLHTVRIQICNNEFALPRGVEKIIGVTVDGVPAHVFNRTYQFLSSGPGDLDYARVASTYRDLMDLGEAPYQFAVPLNSGAGHRLVAFSTDTRDMNVEMKLRGFDSSSKELIEVLKINAFNGGVEGSIVGSWDSFNLTVRAFRELARLDKPETYGYVTLYAVNPLTNEMWLVANYHPADTIPMFRRYRITNKCCVSGDCTHLLALVLCGYTKLADPEDLIPVDNLPALKNMTIAIEAENVGELNKAQAYESNAMRLLTEAKENHHLAQGSPIIIDHERYLMGGMLNRRLL